MEKVLIIGIGNKFREDDGAGIYIVEQLAQKINLPDIYFAQSSGEGTEIMSLWEDFNNVCLFDALMKNDQPGRIVHFTAKDCKIPSDLFKYSSHAFSLAEAVELARVLNKLPKQVEIFGIEGKRFGFGEGLSEEVQQACTELVTVFSKKNTDFRNISL